MHLMGLSIVASLNWYSLIPINSANAQISPISPDNTTPTDVTKSGNVYEINGGTQVDSNLFHSFNEFSVPTDHTAFFNNATSIQNIFSRVTSGSISNIDGLIKANGFANLFLLNPSGIIFGPKASLDIEGSFLATTADSVVFDNGYEFSATNPQASPLLTVNIPIGLNFRDNPEKITVNDSNLAVEPGKTLGLIGGDVFLDNAKLLIPGGQIELGALAETGTLTLNFKGNQLSLAFPSEVSRANVILENSSEVNVRAGGSGDIFINAQNLDVLSGSKLRAGIATKMGVPESQAGDIVIDATGTITIDGNGSVISNAVEELAIGNTGDVEIIANSLLVSNGAGINTATKGHGDAGKVKINASETVSFDGGGRADSFVFKQAKGNAVGIDITANSLSLKNKVKNKNIITSITSETNGRGNGGYIKINAIDNISFDGRSIVESASKKLAKGDAGNIVITTDSLELTNGAQLNVSTFGKGNAGTVEITATDSIKFDGSNSGAFSKVRSEAEGNAEGFSIITDSLEVTNGAQLNVSTFGKGNAGNIVITTDSLKVTNGAQLSTNTISEKGNTISAEGNAGNISVKADNHVILDGVAPLILINGDVVGGGFSSGLFAVTDNAKGRGGDISVSTPSLFISDGAVISARSRSDYFDGGNIEVNVKTLEITGGGQILTSAFSSGNAGEIKVNTSEQVILSGTDPTFFDRFNQLKSQFDTKDAEFVIDPVGPFSGLFANTTQGSSGNGGRIFIEPRIMTIRDGAAISVDSQGIGEGGNIFLKAGSLTLDNEASISAQTASNRGGEIALEVQDLLLLRRESQISATAGNTQTGGDGGNITINTDFIVAFPGNNDISANAFSGSGGDVEIAAQGLFGLVARSRSELVSLLGTETPRELNPVNLSTNDITAISQENPELSGETSFDIEFEIGQLIELPETVVDPASLIAQNPCTLGLDSEFIITGRGGLPPSPNQVLSIDSARVGWVDPTPVESRREGKSTSIPNPQSKIHNQIVPARGWVLNDKGEAILVGYDPTNSEFQRSRQNPSVCPAP